MEARTRYGLILLLIAGILFAFAQSVRCQQHLPKHPPHSSELDFWESLRILPLTVLHYDPASGIADVKYEDKTHIEVFRMQVTKSTAVRGEMKGKIIVIFCGAKHGEGLNERIKYLVQVEKATD